MQARRAINASPLSLDKAADGQRYLRTFVLMSAIPWVIMGLGQQRGSTPTVLHYFRPQDGNPFVFAWIAAILLPAGVLAWGFLFVDGVVKNEALGLWPAFGFG